MKGNDKTIYCLLNKVLNFHEDTKYKIDEYKNEFIEQFLDDKSLDEQIYYCVFLYFFPADSSLEQNSVVFWFEQFKNEKKYTEYNFASDLIECFQSYLTKKSKENFESKVEKAINKFGNYKDIQYFSTTVKMYSNLYKWMVAYLTKDVLYFDMVQNGLNEGITKEKWQNIIEIINQKKMTNMLIGNFNKLNKDNDKLQEEVNNLTKEVKNLTKEVNNLTKEVVNLTLSTNKLKEGYDNLKKENNSLKERIEKIELRDKVKMSIKYLYNALQKYRQNEKIVSYYWDKVREIEDILKRKDFDSYIFLRNFIEDLLFGVTNNLNNQAHVIKSERKLEHIEKYMKGDCKADLSKVVEFFQRFPKIQLFFELNMKKFMQPEEIEKIFTGEVNYDDAYKIIFEEK